MQEQIGFGSYGEVVKAVHKKSGLTVALKFVEGPQEGMTYRSRQLVSEIQILRKLSSVTGNDYTTKLLDVIVLNIKSTETSKTVDTCVILVMEYMPIDLQTTLQNSHKIPFSEDHVIKILYNLLRSLTFLHKCNIMHRDLKPANLLLDQNCNLKLCDFGLARTCHKQKHGEFRRAVEEVDGVEERGRKQVNQKKNQIAKVLEETKEKRGARKRRISNHVVTRFYRAPEVVMMEKKYDEGIDMWSVGCIFAEMLACLGT